MLGRRAIVVAVLMGLAVSAPSRAAVVSEDDALGIGVRIVPGDAAATGGDLAQNGRLWFAAPPGGAITRQFIVQSASDASQALEFSLLPAIVRNGELVQAGGESPVSEWVRFDPPTAVLEPRAAVTVSMELSLPPDAPTAFYDAFLSVSATLADQGALTGGDARTQAVLPGAAAVLVPAWFGIGDAESLRPEFTIDSVQGALIDGVKVLRIRLSNRGQTPIGLRGTTQLSDPELAGRSFGPFDFATRTVAAGETASVDVELPTDVTDGRWRIYVSARQGSVEETRYFEEDLRFVPLSMQQFSLAWWVRGLVATLALVLLGLGIRLVRGPRTARARSRRPRRARRDLSPQALEQHWKRRLSGDADESSEIGDGSNRPPMVRPARAARARAKSAPPSTTDRTPRHVDPPDRASAQLDPLVALERLKELHDRGVLSDEEFETKKRELLGRI